MFIVPVQSASEAARIGLGSGRKLGFLFTKEILKCVGPAQARLSVITQ
jgi:hypothetical protein